MSEPALARLQALLRELIQYDYADLDFGIYRLLRLKRGEVEAFLTEQLPRRVEEVFKGAAGEVHAQLERELAELADRVRQEIDADALAPSGEIKPEYREQKAKAARELIAAYEAKRKQVQEIHVSEEQRAEVFNHLWAFLSRYYESGDFIPKRRYGARETYAVPYNGEEVFFHWANRDQHYVKTAEALRDYAFTVDVLGKPCHVRFTLNEASLPPGNTKGDTRYFFPLPKDATWDKDARTFTLPFQFRLPTETEIEKHGKNTKLQESVLQAALPKIIAAVPDAGLKARLAEIVERKEDEEISLLLKRLRHFCRKNTSDYFIHKNLDGFLRRELEFYLKDQVLHLADIDGDLPAKQRTLRVVRQLAEEVIQFLAQIENVQKRLFEKRKFVLKADYLVPIQNVPRALWKEIITSESQLATWKELFAVEPKKVNEKLLAEHPTLVVSTAHFDEAFKTRLLAGFDDLDEATDGLLIHSENYQALHFLKRKYGGKLKCIYIDPPYNTGSDEFIYKDRYRHSTWLAMVEERLIRARELLSDDGSIFVSIDEHEMSNLRDVLEAVFGEGNFVASVVWQKMFSPKSSARHFSEDHEYILVFAKSGVAWQPTLLPRTDEANARYDNPDNDERGPWTSGDLTARNYYSEGQYEVTSPSGKKFRPAVGTYWRINLEKFQDMDRTERIWWGPKGANMPRLKRFLADVKPGMVPQTLWPYEEVGHTQEAKQELLAIVKFHRTEDVLNTVKPPRLIRRILQLGTKSSGSPMVLDFFAGSGTTAQAVIQQNREDGGQRRFAIVEMGQYFDDLVMQRVTRALYAAEWNDGRPTRLPTRDEAERTPRMVKVLRLESYEDALHNLVSGETLERELPRAKAYKEKVGGDAYRLTYMARLPLEASASMLNLAKLEHPFAYTIEVLGEDGPRTETVDLVETFNFLYGLHVQRIESWRDEAGKRDYRAVKAKKADGRCVLVLWREMDKFDPAVERRFLEARLKQDGPFDEAWINGDCAVPGVQSLDGLFKRLLEEEER